ncbi:MAG: hypothetical protein IJZ46_02310 [Bacilli bacterium]|nr:hypothetical protein [Bacilli bacterium]
MYNRRFRPIGGNRFFGGGFLGPFILGGITGGLLAPNFGPRPVPYYPGPPPFGPGPFPPYYY